MIENQKPIRMGMPVQMRPSTRLPTKSAPKHPAVEMSHSNKQEVELTTS